MLVTCHVFLWLLFIHKAKGCGLRANFNCSGKNVIETHSKIVYLEMSWIFLKIATACGDLWGFWSVILKENLSPLNNCRNSVAAKQAMPFKAIKIKEVQTSAPKKRGYRKNKKLPDLLPCWGLQLSSPRYSKTESAAASRFRLLRTFGQRAMHGRRHISLPFRKNSGFL